MHELGSSGPTVGAYLRMRVIQTLRLMALASTAVLLALAWCAVLSVPLGLGLGEAHDSPGRWAEAFLIRIAVVSPGALAFGVGAVGFYAFRLAFWATRRRFDRMMRLSGLRPGPHGLYGREYKGAVDGIDLLAVLEFIPYHVTRAEPRLLLTARAEVGTHAELRPRTDPAAADNWTQGLFGNPDPMVDLPPDLDHVVVRARDEAWCSSWLAQPGVTAAVDHLLEQRFGAPGRAIRLRHDFAAALYVPVVPAQVAPEDMPGLLKSFARLVAAAQQRPVSSEPAPSGGLTLGGIVGPWRVQTVASNVVRTALTVGSLGLIAAGVLWMAVATAVMTWS
jgi:hypothetical protein